MSLDRRNEETSALNRRPIIFLFLLLCVLFVISYTGRVGQLIGLRSDIADKQVELEAAKDRQAELEQAREYARTEQYTDEVARGQFGMSQPGDELIVPVGAVDPAPAAEADMLDGPSATPAATPLWRQWWQLFVQDAA